VKNDGSRTLPEGKRDIINQDRFKEEREEERRGKVRGRH